MFSWGLVTLAHVLIKDKFGYLTGISLSFKYFCNLNSFCPSPMLYVSVSL